MFPCSLCQEKFEHFSLWQRHCELRRHKCKELICSSKQRIINQRICKEDTIKNIYIKTNMLKKREEENNNKKQEKINKIKDKIKKIEDETKIKLDKLQEQLDKLL